MTYNAAHALRYIWAHKAHIECLIVGCLVTKMPASRFERSAGAHVRSRARACVDTMGARRSGLMNDIAPFGSAAGGVHRTGPILLDRGDTRRRRRRRVCLCVCVWCT